MTKGLLRMGLLAVISAAFLGVASPVWAANFTVTNTNDSGPGSLRQALTDANNTAGDDTITITATGTIDLQSGLGSVTNVEINGPGANKLTVRRDTGGDYPIFKFFNSDVTISGLTVANGNGGVGDVGGIGIIDNGNSHSVTLKGVAVSGNSGGGIDSDAGTLTLIDSTVSGNTTGGSGGGILNRSGSLVLTNSTVSGNTAGDFGGGIYNAGASTLNNSTLSDNSAPQDGFFSGGANLHNGFGATSTFGNTIVANARGGSTSCNLPAGTSSVGYNLDEDGSCGFAGTGDISNQDPKLGALASNGGPTKTHALQTGSPAIDTASPSCPPPATDQRGVTRPRDGDGTAVCDIGAFEAVAADTTPPIVTAVTPPNLAKNVPPNTPIEAIFSERIDCGTVTNSTFVLKRSGTNVSVPATVGCSGNTVTLTPDRQLVRGATYSATIFGGSGGVKDPSDNVLKENKFWIFKVVPYSGLRND